MFKGKLWLDFEDDDEESHYEAAITSCLVRGSQITFEFEGHDPDDGPFSGGTRLEKRGAFHIGDAFFLAQGKRTGATVTAKCDVGEKVLTIEGTWQSTGDPDRYQLFAELER